MGESSKVRFSRDGDQFHYLWATRRCLRLLSPASGLVAITIEGPSSEEIASGDSVEAGEELIDVGEYYGSQDLEKATFVRYIQLKHSTQNPTEAWPPSGLEKTIRGFAKRHLELENRFGTGNLGKRFEFCFISNRPINSDFIEAIEDAASMARSRHPNELKKLERFTSLTGSKLSAFCQLLKFEGGHAAYWIQRKILALETKAYLAGNDVDAPIQLKELVTRRALSESENNPSITKIDVLRVLGITEDLLFPASSRIESADKSIPRIQEAEIMANIVAAQIPVIVHAEGGVGKSVLSQRIKDYLPANSVTVVYDCFGNGEYRRAGSPRHRHKDALVQIANELASLGLCDPLIPSTNADSTDYLRAFAHRVKQSISAIKAKNTQSLLCIAIDAADNAEMASEEFGGEHSFARDLLREPIPDGLRLVVFCRTERQNLLDPPPSVLPIELKPFNRDETATLLRQTYPDAVEYDVDEFHRLTSHNPRVQATALEQACPLPEILRSLGPNPTTVDATIAALLEHAIAQMRDRVGHAEQSQIESICAALAVLRPLVPVTVLAAVSGVHVSAVRSFAHDLGRPLLLMGDAIQFRDEPVETWFRERFKPAARRLSNFVDALQPLSSTSAYVASTLPQLMLEAGQLTELVELALSSSSLPANPIEKRDVEIQRLQFALKASLRARRYVDATKLALKAGEETAGDARQQKLFQDNTDLVAALLEPERIQEIVSRRTFGGGWVGAHHAYEAGLLSHVNDFRGDARSRLRMAYEWLKNWSQLPKEEREHERVDDDDIAEIAIAQFNLHGPKACAAELRRWTPREVSFRAGRIIAKRLIDHCRYDDLDELAIYATNNLCLLLAITLELRTVHKNPPKGAVERALKLVIHKRVRVEIIRFDHQETVLQAITSLVEAAHSHRIRGNDILASVLTRYLPDKPPIGLASRFGGHRLPFLRAYALRAALQKCNLQPADLAHPELRKQLEDKKGPHDSRGVQEFKENVGALLPWHVLWAKNRLTPIDSAALDTEIAAVLKESASATRISYREDSYTSDEIAEIWLDILVDSGIYNDVQLQEYISWADSLKRPLYTPTLTRLSRLCAQLTSFQSTAYEFAQRAYERTRDAREDAESKAQSYIALARAIVGADKSEAAEYFKKAVEVASKIGDEIPDRWQALLDLADRAADPTRPVPETAYRLARCTEVAENYNSDHFEWKGTMTAIAGLCASSSLAIMSRWRDRHFGWSKRLLPTTIHYLLERSALDPKVVPAMVGFRVEWDYSDLVRKALNACSSHGDREAVLNHVLCYVRLENQDPSVWEDLKEIAAANRLSIPDVDQIIQFANLKNNSYKREHYTGNCAVLNKDKDWDVIFDGLDLHSSTGLSTANARFKSYPPPYFHERFFEELFLRVSVGKEPEFIASFSASTEFDLYHVRILLEQFPERWKSRMAIKSALADAVKRVLSRHCMEITKNRYYQQLPLQTASVISGISEQDLIDVVLDSIGQASEIIGSGRLFTLVGLLAGKLSHDEALEALKFGLGLFDSILDEDDGDGPWAAALMPPDDINAALAGYIWSSLAAPESSLRWEAAHVVRGLCALGEQAVLSHLIELTHGKSGGPFADSRLHFYHLHARQWLLIALSRAALDHPDTITPCADFLVRCALKDERHVLVRHFAAKAALALATSGNLQLDVGVIDQLNAVNKPSLPVISSKRYERHKQHVHPMHRESGAKRFTFGYDISRYWFENLGDCFGMSSSEIETEAEKVICDDWRLLEYGNWDKDARARRGYFGDGASSHSHGSYPQMDDLNFYLSYHALMTVAGKLLETVSIHQEPDELDDEFNDWLKWHLLSRADGFWLADRRDPTPLEWPEWKNEKQEDIWRWSVCKTDFNRVLSVDEDRMTLWGRWTSMSGRREENVNISSALVSSDRSASLLRALQTASNPHDYCIPAANDDRMEFDSMGFQLKGWVNNRDHDSKLDQYDPWAGDIRYPTLKPANFVCELLQIQSDSEFRSWHLQSEGTRKEVLWSQVWGSCRSKDDDSETESGRRLIASSAFVQELLGKSNMDLIVEVEIERDMRRYRYEGYKDDGLGYIPPYTRIIVLKANGELHAL
ncbi:hypothetical protein KI811_15765 [Geobacter hydrogenophilus]|uniref:NACHT domain-containing protein n=1 Tax=Geobacter hydrogenophilus TaxID=40983 RepID=A0A9W6LD84_9BACT|nr:AVAST type 3 anti-phage nuclease/ATPase Avs3a [Geobacter hydrogenophilus]MBT0895264.1 hypothetical protein [Geobacter hydrogenophilus]GLI39493.1 hypothetical protein GHYDROH2_29940 [Geobacter hydrogenophilus]